jgi:hypothetical protein
LDWREAVSPLYPDKLPHFSGIRVHCRGGIGGQCKDYVKRRKASGLLWGKGFRKSDFGRPEANGKEQLQWRALSSTRS